MNVTGAHLAMVAARAVADVCFKVIVNGVEGKVRRAHVQ